MLTSALIGPVKEQAIQAATGVVILSFASKSDDANSSSYGAGITSIGGR